MSKYLALVKLTTAKEYEQLQVQSTLPKHQQHSPDPATQRSSPCALPARTLPGSPAAPLCPGLGHHRCFQLSAHDLVEPHRLGSVLADGLPGVGRGGSGE